MAEVGALRTPVITGITPHNPGPSQIAFKFASNGYTDIALLGPDEAHLSSTAAKLKEKFPALKVLNQKVDITSPESIGLASHEVRSQLGAWDVFVHIPGAFVPPQGSPRTTIRGADEDIWWGYFERNVRSLHFIARHFFPKMKRDAVFVNILLTDLANPGAGTLEDKASAEEASVLAPIRVVEHLGKENENAGLKIVNAFAGSKEVDYSSIVRVTRDFVGH